MTAETFFLKNITTPTNYVPNYAYATGNAAYYNYSQASPSGMTSVEVETLVNGGVSRAIADAQANALFFNDPAFSALFTESYSEASDGTYEVSSKSKTKVVADFKIAANETFSFDFSADLALTANKPFLSIFQQI